MDEQVSELERQIKLWHRENEQSSKLEAIAGIGPITASAFVATVGDVRSFKNARQVAAWLGMVPRHKGTGGKATMGGISKRGDVYLRTMLIHGARTVVAQLERKRDASDGWLQKLRCPAQQEYRRGGPGGEERSHRLGCARARAQLRAGLRCEACRHRVVDAHETERRQVLGKEDFRRLLRQT